MEKTEPQIQKLKSQWEVGRAVLVSRLVLDHVTHLYFERQEKDHRKQRDKKGWG